MCSHLCTLSFSSFPLLIFCFTLSFLFSCTCTHPAHVLQSKWRLSYPRILRAKPGALAERSKIYVERKYVDAVVIAFEVEIIAPGSERRPFYGYHIIMVKTVRGNRNVKYFIFPCNIRQGIILGNIDHLKYRYKYK